VNKAFTKEDDDAHVPAIAPPRASLPPGTPNYVTSRGLAKLKAELKSLEQERAQLTAPELGPDRSHLLAQLAARRSALEERLSSAMWVDAPTQPRDEVRFGAVVQLRTEIGSDRTYQIVGVDEAEPSAGLVAFVSPLARALLGRRVGEVATLRTPRGEEELEIVAISYDDPAVS
jgi:transcription elongation factor GreB